MGINITNNALIDKIYDVRGKHVMLDSDLAELYSVETKRLNEQVKRNIKRFPVDFMFQLDEEEWKSLKSQFATTSWGGRRKLPFVFTEHGILMLSSVLNSEKAVEVNIHIMRVFVNIRKAFINQDKLIIKVLEIESKVGKHDESIRKIFGYLKHLLVRPKRKEDIGFKLNKE